MAKEKVLLSLDSDISDRLKIYAKENYMTVSGVITQYVLTLKTNQVRGQLNLNDMNKDKRKK